MRFLASLLLVLVFAPLAAAIEPASHPTAQLMVYRDAAGQPHPVKTPSDWQRRREQFLAGIQEAMGPLPSGFQQLPLDVQVHETVEQAGVPRYTISYNAALSATETDRVTAYLYVPRTATRENPQAAILALHPTGALGKDIVAGNGPRANRQYALELAQRGYVVIAPDYPSFGDLQDYDFAGDAYVSGSMKAIVNHIRAVDVLAAREEVDAERIGVIGHSLGGHNAMFVAVFDPRLKAVVSSCGWCPFHDYKQGNITGWTSDRYMPRLRDAYGLDPDRVPFDFYEVVAAIAPRAFFSSSPYNDSNFSYEGVRKAHAAAQHVFALLGAEQRLVVRYPDSEHDFINPARREAYGFLDRELKHKPTARIPAHEVGERREITITSTADGSEQPCIVAAPASYDAQADAVPLLVRLHSWSANLQQRDLEMEELANHRGWVMIMPNFRGPNQTPEACGSELAQQDILDAVEWACANYRIDRRRIYLTGASGGGHMTMLMAGRHPEVWAAASAWVGISDLAAWHQRHAGDNYGQMLRASCGGAPGESAKVDAQYRDRSPLTWLHRAVDVPLDLAHGVHDGHRGSVPVSHTLQAFNVVAAAQKAATVSDAEIEQISRRRGRLDAPQPDDIVADTTFDREIYLRRTAGKCRVTIFEGGHEGLANAAIEWLARHAKPE